LQTISSNYSKYIEEKNRSKPLKNHVLRNIKTSIAPIFSRSKEAPNL